MEAEGKLNPGMSFVEVCRQLEGWACARVYTRSHSPGLHTWDFTERIEGRTIRTTFEGGKLTWFGAPTPGPSDSDAK